MAYRMLALSTLVLGAVLRLWHLPQQILGGDELHGVRVALGRPLAEILTTFARTDYCIPLAAYNRLVLLADGELTELGVRLPVLLLGLLSLVAVPLAAWPRLGRWGALLLAALVAVSPLLVLYSRIARPYMPAVLLAYLAVMGFEGWWRARSPHASAAPPARWRLHRLQAASYLFGAPLAVYFLPVVAPLVAVPPLLAAVELLRDGRSSGDGLKGWRSWLRLCLRTLAFWALLFGPALPSFFRQVAAKGGEGVTSAEALRAAPLLLAGSANPGVALAFWLAGLAGLALLWHRDRRLLAFTLLPVAAQVLAVLAVSPYGVGDALIFTRYLLVALPFVLTWIAAAFASPFASTRGGPAAPRTPWPALPALRTLAAVLLLATLIAGSPLRERVYRESSFTAHNDLVAFHRPRPRAIAAAAYRGLPDRGSILELPWPQAWRWGRSFYAYQEVHRRRVLVAGHAPFLADPRVDFRNAMPASPEALLRSGARYLVVHRHLAEEEARLREGFGVSSMPGGMPEEVRAAEWEQTRFLLRRLRGEWGAPFYRDGSVWIWDIKAARDAAAFSRDRRPGPRGR